MKSASCEVCPMSSDSKEEKVRVQVMVELSEREQRALSHRLGKKVLLRGDVKRWGLELVRVRLAELVHAHYACECRKTFPARPAE
jgi:hypothetical protein